MSRAALYKKTPRVSPRFPTAGKDISPIEQALIYIAASASFAIIFIISLGIA
jgi:hypothetical protein